MIYNDVCVCVGTIVIHEISLLDIPTGVVSFMMDTNEPAIAVASGTNVYIYKTVRPYFKFTLPLLDVWSYPYIYCVFMYMYSVCTCIVNIRVFNPFSPSYNKSTLKSCYRRNEKDKR